MSNNDWNLEFDSLDLEELSDAELTDVQGGSTGFGYGYFPQNVVQIQQQFANGNYGSFVNQNANQTVY